MLGVCMGWRAKGASAMDPALTSTLRSVYILDFGTGCHLVKELHYFKKKKKSLGHLGGSIG